MKSIRAALGDQRDLSSWGASLSGIVARRGYAEFINGIQRGTHRPLKCCSANLIIIVHAIKGNVGLVAAPAVQCSVACVYVVVNIRADKSCPRLQAQHSRCVAALKWQREYLPRIEYVPDGRIGGVDRRSRTFHHRHGVRYGPELKL